MRQSTLHKIAGVSLMLGGSTIACTPDAHVASVGANPVKAEQAAARAADKARAAMADHKGAVAVAAAEAAVKLSPAKADYRMLLGQAYLSAGRFGSAQTAFEDTLTLAPTQARAKFDLALAETAQGKRQDALAVLHTLDGAVPRTDLGLALVLAGEHDRGITMLVDAARGQDSTARTRQNLALAYALDGRWRESRAVAMQDTTPDHINDQIAGWAALANPRDTSGQVAAMLGVTPVKDPGQPTALALATPASSTVAVALAEPDATPPAPLAAAQPVAGQVSVALTDLSPSPAPVVATPAAPAPVAPVTVAATTPVTPLLLAAAHPAKTALLLRAPRHPARMAFAPVSGPITKGGFVVQLGAYSKASSLETAWAQASRISPQVATLSPVRGEFSPSGAMLIRLSVGGFNNRADALKLCGRIKARGGACFVRASFNDAPLQWAKRSTPTQVASL